MWRLSLEPYAHHMNARLGASARTTEDGLMCVGAVPSRDLTSLARQARHSVRRHKTQYTLQSTYKQFYKSDALLDWGAAVALASAICAMDSTLLSAVYSAASASAASCRAYPTTRVSSASSSARATAIAVSAKLIVELRAGRGGGGDGPPRRSGRARALAAHAPLVCVEHVKQHAEVPVGQLPVRHHPVPQVAPFRVIIARSGGLDLFRLRVQRSEHFCAGLSREAQVARARAGVARARHPPPLVARVEREHNLQRPPQRGGHRGQQRILGLLSGGGPS